MRRLAAVGVFAVLLVSAGCLGGGEITQDEVAANETYDWTIETTVRYNVTGDTFHAVTLITNGSPVEAYRITEFQGEQPIQVSAVRFRYPNGTVVTLDVSAIDQGGARTVIHPPADEGRLAYTAQSFPKEFTIGVARDGSYTVVLPPRMRISVPLLGTISPGGADITVVDDRVHLRWDSLSGGEIALHYYLERDFWLFTAVVVGGIVLAIAGVLYFRHQISRLVNRREQAGLDIED